MLIKQFILQNTTKKVTLQLLSANDRDQQLLYSLQDATKKIFKKRTDHDNDKMYIKTDGLFNL